MMSSDLVVTNSELYEQIARIARMDQVIYEAEEEVKAGAKPIPLAKARKELEDKYIY